MFCISLFLDYLTNMSFPGGACEKNLPANAEDSRVVGSISRSGRSSLAGKGNHSSTFA